MQPAESDGRRRPCACFGTASAASLSQSAVDRRIRLAASPRSLMKLEKARCAACGSPEAEGLFNAPDPDGLEVAPFAIVRCAACGMVFVSPRPADADLGRFYVAGYYDKPGEDSGGLGRS